MLPNIHAIENVLKYSHKLNKAPKLTMSCLYSLYTVEFFPYTYRYKQFLKRIFRNILGCKKTFLVSESLEASEKYSKRYFLVHSHYLEFSRKHILKAKMRYFDLTVAYEGRWMRGQVNPGNLSPMRAIASRSVWNTNKHVSESLILQSRTEEPPSLTPHEG